ncbi:biosynthetic-type acetolactate synthase large subunit [Halosquirtibacter laminarini]|uniref:Biosynthetic-type acetolactate synthase large subunit n=1 Tax=Halosquirtibacter laminarini TaxID=3374600 RepID=A0AC61NGR7_9BACT|nr:biosynthetic-type acetolactate synthase large subunit [Prolixibacteraceae bacterium]
MTTQNHSSLTSNEENVSGAKALILSLLEEGVDTIFGYPGGAIMPVYDALYDYLDQVNHILSRHEQGAIHAAQGYARVSGKVGVCFATSGPGATNLMTGIADAMIDSTPLVCFTGQVTSPLLGTDAFQESDIVGMSMPVTKWNYQVTSADEIAEVVAKAFFIASTGRPGPVLIDISKDAQFSKVAFSYNKCRRIRSYLPEQPIEKRALVDAAKLIDDAKKPLMLVGQGVVLSGAEKTLLQFAEKTDIPMASTLLGLSAVPSDHPLLKGMLGMHGNYGPNVMTNECDLLIAVGMRFDDRVTGDINTYAKQAKVIHIEIDPSEINKNIPVEVAICSDAKKALKMLCRLVKENKHTDWLKEFTPFEEKEFDAVIKNDLNPVQNGISMAEVVNKVADATNHQAIMATDVGQQQMMAARYFKFKDSRCCVTSGGLGTMGFGLPAAVGAAVGNPNKTVIAFLGDGGFQMTIQEMATIKQENLNVKVVVLNNEFLGMVRQWQELFFDRRYSFTEMNNPDFIKIAQGYGFEAKLVDKREDLDGAISEMLATEGPYFLEVRVEKEENVFPMVPSGATVSDVRLGPNS